MSSRIEQIFKNSFTFLKLCIIIVITKHKFKGKKK